MPRKNQKRKRIRGLDIGQTLLKNRHLFCMGEIDLDMAERLSKEMFVLDTISNKPIILAINSPGGSIPAGMSIIDTMKAVNSPVVTIITGEACSMAALISIAGDKRMMTCNSIWMAHPMTAGSEDYYEFMKDRIKGLDLYDKVCEEYLKKYTKLTAAEITKAKHGELWLTAEQCKQKGIIDLIVLQGK